MQTNAGYHADRTHLSSSMLKLLLTDRQRFYEKWILNMEQDESKPAFEEGTVTHSLILEPEKVASEYAFYEGLRRAGKHYEDFVAANPGKRIILASTRLKAEKHKAALERRPEAQSLFQNGKSEENLFGNILGVPVKARADYINVDDGIIVDLKTSALPSDADIFKSTVGDYMYDLSAALYCKIAEQVHGKPFTFYWVVISKLDGECHVYKMSPKTLQKGTELVTSALIRYKACKESGDWLTDAKKLIYTNSTYEVKEI